MADSFRLLREAPILSRARSWLTVVLIVITAVAVWIFSRKTRPPEVDFVKVTRETIISSLGTNGKVEPIEWLPARAERAGTIAQVFIARGQQVRKDQPLVELDTRVVTAELGKAQAAIQEAKTQEQVLDQGGRIAERQQVEADLARTRLDLEAAQKQQAALERLMEKQAATRLELDNARQVVDQLQLRIHALEQHKAALVTGSDREIAGAKLQEAESAA
jgi:HlyD family secretion protein